MVAINLIVSKERLLIYSEVLDISDDQKLYLEVASNKLQVCLSILNDPIL